METFRKNLIELFNKSELPIDARYYVFKDVYRDIFELYNNMLEQQGRTATTAAEDFETEPKMNCVPPNVEGTEVE